MHRRLLPFVLCAAALAFPGCESVSPSADDPDESTEPLAPVPNETELVVLSVTGMTCSVICARQVRNMLLSAPGVLRVRVDWEDREARCLVTRGTDPQSLLEALRSPYAARVVQ